MNKNFFSLNKDNGDGDSDNNKFSLTSSITGIVTGFFNGLFGSGGGAILVPALEKFLGYKAHKAHASAVSITLPISIISLIVYLRNFKEFSELDNNLDISVFNIIIFVCIGGVLGAYIGARVLKKIPSIWLHRIFGIFMLIGAWRMII
ncbi:MAG: sulfite exporter TauE/SafE family protein [bacterium]